MKKTFSMILAALILAGTATTAFAADNAPAALYVDEVVLNDEATYIMGDKPLVSGSLDDAFDGDMSTIADFGVDGPSEYWIGIKLDGPTVLTYVEVTAPDYDGDGMPDRTHAPFGTMVEGSNDGVNWEFILELGDNYDEFLEYDYDLKEGYTSSFGEVAYDGEDSFDDDALFEKEYTYYRVWNNTNGIAIYGDVTFYGYYTGPRFKVGDLNCDEAVNIDDAILLFRHNMLPAMYPIDEYPGESIDFNGDGVLDIADAIQLFRYSMLPEKFPIVG